MTELSPQRLARWFRRARLEKKFLAALLLVASSLWIFLELADEVIEGGTHELDAAMMMMLRSPGDPADPIGPVWLEGAARDITALGSFSVLTLLTLATIGYLLLSGKRLTAVVVLIAVVGGQALSNLLKLGFDRPRPDLVPHAVQVFGASFPSGHSMMAAVTYLTLGVLLAGIEARARMKLYFLAFALALAMLVGISRIYLGVHWPSDVVGGWTLGSAWALTCWILMRWLQRRGAVETPPAETRIDQRS